MKSKQYLSQSMVTIGALDKMAAKGYGTDNIKADPIIVFKDKGRV